MIAESAEMRFLCPVTGYTLLDQKQNTHMFRLKMFNVTERRERQNKNLYEHNSRMTTYRLPKILLN
jgi:hypothetical protein